MDSPSPPPAPDPKETAAAQATMNKETAVAQTGLNSTNQITPDGSLTYEQIGKWADGTPRFQATTALSDANKAIYDVNQGTKLNIATIGKDQSARIGDLLGTPFKLGNEATEKRVFDLSMNRLTPQFAKDEETLRTKLVNSGIREGSDAWNSEMGRMGQNKNDAINSLLLSGRALANQELTAERQAPINEIGALLSGSQVANPNFVSTPQSQVAGVDYAGMVRDKYNADLNAAKMKSDSNNALMGGLFGLAGTIGTAGIKYSDRRLKTDIREVGTLNNGLPVYLYRRKDTGETELGVMADEVRRVKPSAVVRIGGFDAVNYDLAVGA